MELRAAIVGGGVSGCLLSSLLQQAGWVTEVFEKSRGIGGRCGVRRHPQWGSFHHGAQFFTHRSPLLDPVFHQLQQLKLIETFGQPIGYIPESGPAEAARGGPRYIGAKAMNHFVKHWASQATKIHTQQRIATIEQDSSSAWHLTSESGRSWGGFTHCILAIPPADGRRLWPERLGEAMPEFDMDPCWALMAVSQPVKLPWPAAFVRRGALSWYHAQPLADDKLKWLIHAGPQFSKRFLETPPEQVAQLLCTEVSQLLQLETTWHHLAAHRWRYASGSTDAAPEGCLWSPEHRLGYAGDWLCGGRIEGAMTSAYRLFQLITKV